MLVDSHVHLDAAEFEHEEFPGALELTQEARIRGVTQFVLPAVWPANFKTVQTLARQIPGAAYALGIHPLYVHQCPDESLEQLRLAAQSARSDPLFVAIGEIGLDQFVPALNQERQLGFFQNQLRLARDLDLPVIMHVRRAADPIRRECRKFAVNRGIAHAFNGSEQQALALIELGFCLGFGGAFTFARALQLRRLASALPLASLVLETDAPDIAPEWLHPRNMSIEREGKFRINSPVHLPRIAHCLAQLREIEFEEVARTTTENVHRCLPGLARSNTAL